MFDTGANWREIFLKSDLKTQLDESSIYLHFWIITFSFTLYNIYVVSPEFC